MRSKTNILALLISIAMLSLVPSARAADSCKPVFDALLKVAATPNHSYTTTANGGKQAAAETIFANGQKYIYIQVRGKWMRLPVTSQDVIEQEKEKEQQGKSTCQLLRTESVNGEAATLYSVHREYEGTTEDGQMWVSKSSGLLLRVEEDVTVKNNQVKEHRSTRFEYQNIQAPV